MQFTIVLRYSYDERVYILKRGNAKTMIRNDRLERECLDLLSRVRRLI